MEFSELWGGGVRTTVLPSFWWTAGLLSTISTTLRRLRHRKEDPATSPEEGQPRDHHTFSASLHRPHGARRRTTITDERRRRTAAGSRWWKWGARGTRWRNNLRLRGGATSVSGDTSSDKAATGLLQRYYQQPPCANYSNSVYTNTTLPDMAHHMEMLTYAEYAYAATNVQLHRSEGEKVSLIPNTFKEATALPEAARWKAASDKQMESLRAYKVYNLVRITSIPTGAERDQPALGLQDHQGGQLI